MRTQPGTSQRPSRAAAIAHLLREAPVSVGLSLIVVAAFLIARVWRLDLAAGVVPTVDQHRAYTVLTALVLPQTAVAAVVTVLLSLSLVAYAERLLGSRRTLLIGVIGGVVSILIGIAGQAVATRWSNDELLGADVVADPLLVIIVISLAASALAPALWRRRIRLVSFALLISLALYAGDTDSWFRLGAWVVGYGIGEVLGAERKDRRWWRSSVYETRVLIAAVVMSAALGPISALRSGGGRGPLAQVQSMFLAVNDRIQQRCGTADALAACDHPTIAVIARGAGPALLAIMPLILLAVAAWGLYYGRRSGWILAIATSGVMALAAVASVMIRGLNVGSTGTAHTIEVLLWGLSAVGIPLIVIVLLVGARRVFQVRADTRAVTRATMISLLAFVVAFGTFMVAEFTTRNSWNGQPTAGELLLDATRSFLPPGIVPFAQPHHYPRGGPGVFVWHWIGVAFWLVMVATLLWLFARARDEFDRDAVRVAHIIERTDAGTLGWLGTWAGTQHWFGPGDEYAVSYRVAGGVALSVSDPVATIENRADAIKGFAEFAQSRGWIPAFYSVHDATRNILHEMGWSSMVVAEETVLDTETWSMAGSAGAKIRHPYTRLQREGVEAVWTTWDELAPAVSRQIRAMSEQWVADKALPEMGFTLGSLPEMQDPRVRLMLAFAPDGTLHGVTSWLPAFDGDTQVAWTLDVMRRAPEALNGVMEFLIAAVVLRAKEDGIATVSLSGAPLTRSESEGAPRTAIDDVLGWLARALEPAYGFRSLFRFKAKFRPVHHDMWLVYPDPLELPTIGLAVARAYLPTASTRDALGLMRGVLEGSRGD